MNISDFHAISPLHVIRIFVILGRITGFLLLRAYIWGPCSKLIVPKIGGSHQYNILPSQVENE